MKKYTGIIISLIVSISMASVVFAGAADLLSEFSAALSGQQEQETGDQPADVETIGQPAEGKSGNQPAEGESGGQPGEGGEGESGGQPGEGGEGESGGQPGEGESGEGQSGGGSGEGQQTLSPTEGPHIIKDEPVSTTGNTYGYQGTFDAGSASADPVIVSSGAKVIDSEQILCWEQSAVQNNDYASFTARNSYIRGETDLDTEPLAGNPGNLLVAGNIRTTLGLGNSQSFYINSTIVSRNWAALSTDAAKPALKPGAEELSLYAYGTDAITMDGGYGAYSDLFCNFYSYGSHVQAAEIGIISGTYGKVTIGTIEAGEQNPALASVLTGGDMNKREDKTLGSVIEGGRNALMIHSVNLPPYWEYEGYSQEELPLLETRIIAEHSVLRTDLSLDKGVEYEGQKQAYINHSAGSVLLIKSTNAEIILDSCELTADENGTGNLIQTVYNNDTMFMNAVPDGEQYPGIHITANDMDLKGDIAHEDYQRDLYLTLCGTTLLGAMNEYDCAHWNEVSAAEGFTDYCLDASYNTHHGLEVTLEDASVWTVTEDSRLSRLLISDNSTVNGIIYVDGIKQMNQPGSVYEGNVLVTPSEGAADGQAETAETSQAAETSQTTEQTQTVEQEMTTHEHNWIPVEQITPITCTQDGVVKIVCTICGEEAEDVTPATGHLYMLTDYKAPTCTEDGYEYYECVNPNCTANYTDVLAATGHNYQWNGEIPATCETEGYIIYKCSNCGNEYTDVILATGHNYVWTGEMPATCDTDGYIYYECNVCGAKDTGIIPATGHDYVYMYSTPNDSLTHDSYYECTKCGDSYTITEYHTGSDPCICGYTGPVG